MPNPISMAAGLSSWNPNGIIELRVVLTDLGPNDANLVACRGGGGVAYQGPPDVAAAVVHTAGDKTGIHNLSVYRQQPWYRTDCRIHDNVNIHRACGRAFVFIEGKIRFEAEFTGFLHTGVAPCQSCLISSKVSAGPGINRT
jgi:hypothetical protein